MHGEGSAYLLCSTCLKRVGKLFADRGKSGTRFIYSTTQFNSFATFRKNLSTKIGDFGWGITIRRLVNSVGERKSLSPHLPCVSVQDNYSGK